MIFFKKVLLTTSAAVLALASFETANAKLTRDEFEDELTAIKSRLQESTEAAAVRKDELRQPIDGRLTTLKQELEPLEIAAEEVREERMAALRSAHGKALKHIDEHPDVAPHVQALKDAYDSEPYKAGMEKIAHIQSETAKADAVYWAAVDRKEPEAVLSPLRQSLLNWKYRNQWDTVAIEEGLQRKCNYYSLEWNLRSKRDEVTRSLQADFAKAKAALEVELSAEEERKFGALRHEVADLEAQIKDIRDNSEAARMYREANEVAYRAFRTLHKRRLDEGERQESGALAVWEPRQSGAGKA